MWEPLVDRFACDHRVLVPDLRGFGRSEAPRGSYAKHQLAADVLALLDIEDIERATIIGHDWGGWIAWLLALEHPDRVERFAALDIPPPWRFDPSLKRLPHQLLFGSYQYAISAPFLGQRLVRSRSLIRSFIQKGSGGEGRVPWHAADHYAEAIARPERAHVSVALYRTFLLRELPAIIRGTYTERELQVPGLAIMGGDSAVTKLVGAPEPGPNLKVEMVEGVGHFVVDEAPQIVGDLLDPFLAMGREGIEPSTYGL